MTNNTFTPFDYIGTVCDGTLQPRDLIPAFERTLETLGRNVEKFQGDYESDDAYWQIEELIDHLCAVAPRYVYFGAHEGDGADFGFWIDWDAIHNDANDIDNGPYIWTGETNNCTLSEDGYPNEAPACMPYYFLWIQEHGDCGFFRWCVRSNDGITRVLETIWAF